MKHEKLVPTTIAIPASLLNRAKHTAVDERSTLRALIAEGLGHVLQQRQQRAARPDAELTEAK